MLFLIYIYEHFLNLNQCHKYIHIYKGQRQVVNSAIAPVSEDSKHSVGTLKGPTTRPPGL